MQPQPRPGRLRFHGLHSRDTPARPGDAPSPGVSTSPLPALPGTWLPKDPTRKGTAAAPGRAKVPRPGVGWGSGRGAHPHTLPPGLLLPTPDPGEEQKHSRPVCQRAQATRNGATVQVCGVQDTAEALAHLAQWKPRACLDAHRKMGACVSVHMYDACSAGTRACQRLHLCIQSGLCGHKTLWLCVWAGQVEGVSATCPRGLGTAAQAGASPPQRVGEAGGGGCTSGFLERCFSKKLSLVNHVLQI